MSGPNGYTAIVAKGIKDSARQVVRAFDGDARDFVRGAFDDIEYLGYRTAIDKVWRAIDAMGPFSIEPWRGANGYWKVSFLDAFGNKRWAAGEMPLVAILSGGDKARAARRKLGQVEQAPVASVTGGGR
jgi:hypothetical protein